MNDDLLNRARKDRAERDGKHRDYLDYWDNNESREVAGRAESFLGVSVDRESLTKIAGAQEHTLWQFDADGRTFLAGVYWTRNPGRNSFFIALKVWQRPGKIDWPPPDDATGSDWCPSGYHRLHVLADLADAIEEHQGIDEWAKGENKLVAPINSRSVMGLVGWLWMLAGVAMWLALFGLFGSAGGFVFAGGVVLGALGVLVAIGRIKDWW